MEENFDVIYERSAIDDNTVLVTSTKSWEEIDKYERDLLSATIRNYNGRKMDVSSVFLADSTNTPDLTLESVDELALGINSDYSKVSQANALILRYLHTNGLFGRYVEILKENVPTNYKLMYGLLEEDDTRQEDLEEVKLLIDSFNRDVDIEKVIADAVIGTILEGNYSMYCNMVNGNSAYIVHYPLEVVKPSGYTSRGNDVLEFDISTLKKKLQKTYKKTRKNKKVYYENMDKEVKANYPPEVYTAYHSGETLCRLSTEYSGFLKINHLGRTYGVSALFKALKPLIVLDNLMAADVSDSKARAKKIIFQKMRKELLDGGKKGLVDQQHSHAEAAAALKTSSCLYTGAPGVESLEYVVPKSTETDYKYMHEIYTADLLRALGLPFLDSGSTTSVAKTNVSLLLRLINSITVDLNRIIEHFYEALLVANGYDVDLCPKFRIADAEENDLSIRKDLADFAFNVLGCSYETAYKLLDIDVKSEAVLRKAEAELGYDKLFQPHQTAYTYTGSSGNDEGGREADKDSQDEDKQQYDQEEHEENK